MSQTIDPQAIITLINLGASLTEAGIHAVGRMRDVLHGLGMTEAEMAVVIDQVMADAVRRKALADADAKGPF